MIAKRWVGLFCVMAFCSGLRAQGLVANSSFELGTQITGSTGSYSQLIPGSSYGPAAGSLSNWTATSTTTNAAAGAFFPAPGGGNWSTKQWDGNFIGYLQVNGAGTVTMSQTLNVTLQNDTTYSLVFQRGRRAFTPRQQFEVRLWVGDTAVYSAIYRNEVPQEYWYIGTQNQGSPDYVSRLNDPLAGQPLRVTFSVTGEEGVITEAFFDKVDVLVTPGPLRAPSIKQGGITPVFSTSNTIQPGSWISIYGENFTANPVVWKNDFPTTLGGISVKINGKPAYIWYASRTQLNVQAPTDSATGAAPVTVTTPLGTASGTVTLGAYGPSFSLLDGTHLAAIVVTPGKPGNSGAGYDIIGPAGSSLGYPTRPVKAGETLVLYGVGFGPTTPNVPSGLPFYGAANCVNPPRITIGGVPAKVDFAGVVSAGLYQFNIVVPSTNSGDQPVQAIAGGMLTPPFAVVVVQ